MEANPINQDYLFLDSITTNTDAAVEFCLRQCLINDNPKCEMCNYYMVLYVDSSRLDTYIRHCPNYKICHCQRTIRKGSIFQGSHIPLPKLLELFFKYISIFFTIRFFDFINKSYKKSTSYVTAQYLSHL